MFLQYDNFSYPGVNHSILFFKSPLKVHKLREKGKVTRFDEVYEASVPSRSSLKEEFPLRENNSSRWRVLTSHIKETIEKVTVVYLSSLNLIAK